LGPEGWSIIVELSTDELNRLTELERFKRLDDENASARRIAAHAASASSACNVATLARQIDVGQYSQFEEFAEARALQLRRG
jgi:hypothetical protein